MNCACGKPLARGSKTGKCRACLAADPEFRARRGQAIRAAWTPEKRARMGETTSAWRMAHIPKDYQADYRAIVRKAGASEAGRMIHELASLEARRPTA